MGKKPHHRACNLRLEWRLDLLLPQEPKIDVLVEERMSLDLLRAVNTQSFRRVARQQTGEDTSCVGADHITKKERAVKDFLIHHVGCFCTSKLSSLIRRDGRKEPYHRRRAEDQKASHIRGRLTSTSQWFCLEIYD